MTRIPGVIFVALGIVMAGIVAMTVVSSYYESPWPTRGVLLLSLAALAVVTYLKRATLGPRE
jgi:membrane protein implicated in regulation of membrane protease activity